MSRAETLGVSDSRTSRSLYRRGPSLCGGVTIVEVVRGRTVLCSNCTTTPRHLHIIVAAFFFVNPHLHTSMHPQVETRLRLNPNCVMLQSPVESAFAEEALLPAFKLCMFRCLGMLLARLAIRHYPTCDACSRQHQHAAALLANMSGQ
jgi:hypothetical protein